MKFSKLAFCLLLLLVASCLVLLFVASTCFAHMFTITDLGTLGGTQSNATGINNSGQVVGLSYTSGDAAVRPFRTAPNSAINPATDDLRTLGGSHLILANGVNSSGQVVGNTWGFFTHGFRTAPNSAINPATDDLGVLGGPVTMAYGINDSGQVVGDSWINFGLDFIQHAFRTAPNRPISPATDDLGTLCRSQSWAYDRAYAINASGQVVGESCQHAFRTAANMPINPATDDLGTLGGDSGATAINDFGQVVGWSNITSDNSTHAFRTAANRSINPATDDLGTLGGGTFSEATGIDSFGQVVGYAYISTYRAFLYSNGVMHDLNDEIPPSSGWELQFARATNNVGQIVGQGFNGDQYHAFLLTPIYKAFVQQPINADGTSVFSVKLGMIPVKFAVTQYHAQPSCSLPATIAITRAVGGTLAAVDESTYSSAADNGSHFRIDPTACQYVYNLAASALGVGTYRVDISMKGIMVGHTVFTLK